MTKYPTNPFREMDDLAIGYINGDPVATREFKGRVNGEIAAMDFESVVKSPVLVIDGIYARLKRFWNSI